jgi:CheY-like chemotaxis protein
MVVGDADRLRQVLLNLLNNAIKFTPEGSVVLACWAGGGDMVRFEVRDDGIGIAPDQIGTLFQRFTQVDRTIARRFGGSGLGLAISKALVSLMGGEIGLESVEGVGSTFWFTVSLPRTTKAIAALPSGAAIPPCAGRVLVVEDVMINRELARSVLRSGGFEVDLACDGDEAVAMARARDYDLILMDVQMPGTDGLAATRQIRALASDRGRVPILGMTANVLPAQVLALLDAGMIGHVGKPFRKPELLAAVTRATRIRRSPAAPAIP